MLVLGFGVFGVVVTATLKAPSTMRTDTPSPLSIPSRGDARSTAHTPGPAIAQIPTAPPTPSEQGDIQTYYPQSENIVRWYEVKDVQTGQPMDTISFTVIGKTSLDNGKTVYLIENRHALGINMDYQEITPDHVLLHRLVNNYATQDPLRPNILRDHLFTPPLPILRAPLVVGRAWTGSAKTDNGITQSYSSKVESRVTFSLVGQDFQDCIQVVRTRDGTPDYKTIYCPKLGIAAMETLISDGKWFRAELFAVTSARLVLTGVRVVPDGCEHILDHVGFLPDEDLHVTMDNTTLPSGVERFTSQRRSSEYIHIGLGAQAKHGRWLVTVKGTKSQAFAYYVINWTGTCRGSFLAPPPSFRPSFTLIGQEAVEQGQIIYIMMGSGWKAGESLTSAQKWPGKDVPSISIGKADDFGVSPVILSYLDIPSKGTHTFTLKGETRTATLTVEYREDGLCFVK